MSYRIAVVGGGTMGAGIAYATAFAGGSALVIEPDGARAEALDRTIRETAEAAVARGKLDAAAARALASRVSRHSAIEAIPPGLDLVIESVPERLTLKLEVLARIDARAPLMVASNTSALSISRLAEAVGDASRFLGMHFFNPVWSFRLVELVHGAYTSKPTLERARRFVEWLGKESLTARDVAGFATSRLDLIASLEAMRMLESGVASAEDIDRAAVLAYRHPVGPLRLSDIVGLDVRLDIARVLEAAHGSRFAPPAILQDLVAQGRLGVKSGQGFYRWPDDPLVTGAQAR